MQAEQQPDRRGLAGPVRAEETEHLTRTDGEAEVCDAAARTEGTRQVGDLDDGRHGVAPRLLAAVMSTSTEPQAPGAAPPCLSAAALGPRALSLVDGAGSSSSAKMVWVSVSPVCAPNAPGRRASARSPPVSRRGRTDRRGFFVVGTRSGCTWGCPGAGADGSRRRDGRGIVAAHRGSHPFRDQSLWDYGIIMVMVVPYETTGRTRQKSRTRLALVEATRDLLAEGLTPRVEDAAERSGISRTTAYRYFPNQRSLLVAAQPHIQPQTLLGDDAPADPRARLDAFMAEFTRYNVQWEPQLRAALRLSLEQRAERPAVAAGPSGPVDRGCPGPTRPQPPAHRPARARGRHPVCYRHRSADLVARHRRPEPRAGSPDRTPHRPGLARGRTTRDNARTLTTVPAWQDEERRLTALLGISPLDGFDVGPPNQSTALLGDPAPVHAGSDS